MDRTMCYASWNLVNCCTTVGTSCTTNWSNGVRASRQWASRNYAPGERTHWQCINCRKCSQQSSTTDEFCGQHDWLAVAKFLSKSRVWDNVQHRSTHIFGGIQFSLKHSVGRVEERRHAKNQLDPSRGFDRTPTCDRQTKRDKHNIHDASIVSFGRNILIINVNWWHTSMNFRDHRLVQQMDHCIQSWCPWNCQD